MESDAALDVLKALAEVEQLLVSQRSVITGGAGVESAYHHLMVWDTPRRDPPHPLGARYGLWIAAALVARRADGHEVEWTCHAGQSGEAGWLVEREVVLNESPVGEPVALASNELPTVEFSDTSALVSQLPELVRELLALSEPNP